ncbi:MAG: alpha/beta hydrolase [Flavobacteriales bacterium]|nr:alpha/beta hydrolase [Flavobacteriales bacterium]
MKKAAYTALFLVIAISLAFMLGPKPSEPVLDPTPMSIDIPLDSLDRWLAYTESGFKTLKPNNEARIEWYNDSISVTEYAVVYLHGFTASHEEGDPVHRAFAKRYGCNLYLPRLYGHGLDTIDPLIDITPDNYLQTAKEAIAVGKKIGKKVILMSCSTGGTLGIYLAANDPGIDALICYSPNVEIFDPNSKVLTKPWGLQLARLISGSDFRQYDASDEFKKYWQTKYRLEGLVTVQSLIDHTMNGETFSQIKQPIFVGGYYKDAAAQDSVVSVDAMRKLMPLLGTSENQKRMVEFPVGAHVLTNPLRNPDVEPVKEATFRFAEDVLRLQPIAEPARSETPIME